MNIQSILGIYIYGIWMVGVKLIANLLFIIGIYQHIVPTTSEKYYYLKIF